MAFLRTACTALSLALLSRGYGDAVSEVKDGRPNIIFIMADDLGVGEIGLFPSENPHGQIDTPNIDQFGEEGIRFTSAYAGYTVCAPSRTTLFTGTHSGNFVKHNLSGTSIFPSEIKTLPYYLQKPILVIQNSAKRTIFRFDSEFSIRLSVLPVPFIFITVSTT